MSPDDQIPADDWRDLLSALLDGELAPDEEERVLDLVAGSPDAQEELAALTQVRTLVRDLPAVDPPFGFYERMLRPPKATKPAHRFTGVKVGGAVAAAAAAVVLIVGVTPATDSVVPPVAAYAERHLEMDEPAPAEPDQAEPDEATPTTVSTDPAATDFAPMAEGELDAMGAPDQLTDGFERMSGYQNPTGALHLVYSDGTLMVSVYEQVGVVAWDRLPAGSVVQVGELTMWTMVGDDEEVMVFERGPAVYTVVAQVDRDAHDEMVEIAEELPSGTDPSMLDRFRTGCRSVAARFSMGSAEP